MYGPSALLVSLALAAPPGAAAQQLSPEEQRIVAAVDSALPEATKLLERLVNQNSGTLNLAGVRAVGAMLEPEFQQLGFTTRWIDQTEVARAGHLFAERKGTRGKRVLLIGHLDTVFEPESPFQRWEVHGDSAVGPGTSDMKGGDVILLYALKALAAAGQLEGTTITVALTGDEEKAGRPLSVARRDLIAAGRESDVALCFEDGIAEGAVVYATTARRGAVSWRLETTGVQGHSSQVFGPRLGHGAIYEAARILEGFRGALAHEPRLTYNPGVIVGGTTAELGSSERGSASGKTNIVAQTAIVIGDLRASTPEQLARAQRTMQSVVARHLPQTGATLTFEEGYPPMADSPANRSLLAELNQVSRALGYPAIPALDPARRGAADISFVAPFVPSLSGLGAATDHEGHSPGEYTRLSQLPVQIKRAALLLHRLTRGPAA